MHLKNCRNASQNKLGKSYSIQHWLWAPQCILNRTFFSSAVIRKLFRSMWKTKVWWTLDKQRSCASGFFLLTDLFEFKTKNAFVATALLRWLLLLLSLSFEYLRKQTQADIHELITQLTEWLWEFLVSSHWWLNAAKTHAHLWLFCWLNWPSFFGATFLGFLFFSFQASPKYSCC